MLSSDMIDIIGPNLNKPIIKIMVLGCCYSQYRGYKASFETWKFYLVFRDTMTRVSIGYKIVRIFALIFIIGQFKIATNI